MIKKVLFVSSGTKYFTEAKSMKRLHPRWDSFHLMAFGYGLENILSMYPIIVLDNAGKYFSTDGIIKNIQHKSPRSKVVVVDYGLQSTKTMKNENVVQVQASKGFRQLCEVIHSLVSPVYLVRGSNVIRFPKRRKV